jgi:AmmeMemoRadiSam system protein B
MVELRPAAVSGTFYPASRAALASLVDSYLAEVRVPGDAPVPKAIIVPHAGYRYSGPVAAAAFARLRKAGPRIKRVILLGPAHHFALRGMVAPRARGMSTPLGVVEIDEEALAPLHIGVSEVAHALEHSLEVELPFLQRVAPRARIVPIAVGHAPAEDVAAVLAACWGHQETAVVVSSDLSHYLTYEEARVRDRASADAIVALDAKAVAPERACGAASIAGLLTVARARRLRGELFDLRSSGDTAGEHGRVVGYGAFGFFETETENDRPS